MPPPQLDLPDKVLRQTRFNLVLAVALVLGYIALAVWAFYFYRHGAKDRAEHLVAAVKQRLLQDAGPLTEEVISQSADVLPPAADALFGQIEQDLPTLTRTLERQGKEVAEHLETTIQKDLEARYRAARPQFEAILRKEFPEITDEAVLGRMTDQFEVAFDKLIRRYHLREFRERTDRTARLWNSIPPEPLPPGGVKALGEELNAEIKEWMRLKVIAEVLGSFGKEGGQ